MFICDSEVNNNVRFLTLIIMRGLALGTLCVTNGLELNSNLFVNNCVRKYQIISDNLKYYRNSSEGDASATCLDEWS